MLARLLRRLLGVQVLCGAWLGWYISPTSGTQPELMALWALGLPLLIGLGGTLLTTVKSRTPGSAAPWWRALPGVFVAGIRVFVVRQPWALARPNFQAALPAAAPRIPVLLVHGYICNHRVWDDVAPALRAAGHPVLTVDLEPLFTSIDDYAPLVEQAVAELCRQTGAQKVALVGHSMGGLVIRAWMRAHGINRVARVVTLGSPHVGTQIDPYPQTANGVQMAWHSDWLQALADSESSATRQLIRIALTLQDNIVYPQQVQVLAGAQVTVFEGMGHLELCLNRQVIAWLLGQLDDLASDGRAESRP